MYLQSHRHIYKFPCDGEASHWPCQINGEITGKPVVAKISDDNRTAYAEINIHCIIRILQFIAIADRIGRPAKRSNRNDKLRTR